ncbi:RHS repeat domain-containing protein [Snodgrassella communis]|uniref:RHS repeat domain-containing protein n=1 Tax=Snodgrassella communis TaxID=2946699 RepID=UPI001EF47B59|nr:RHS repeat-associated core domain-containing protein [Snodgrassella communis]
MRVAYGWKPDSDWGTSPLWQANLSEGQTLKNASYHYLISDHLGTPQLAINSAGEQSWKINSDAFGNSELDANNQITMNLRFPGQYYDAETGLSYNYFRDYDAKTGRYIQSDPIGLAGGINTYGYVGGNPLVYSDPTGEFAQVMVPVAVAAAFVVAACIVSPVCNKSLPNVQFPNIGSGIFGGVDELPYLNSRHKGEDNLLDRCENNKGLGHNPFDPKDRC